MSAHTNPAEAGIRACRMDRAVARAEFNKERPVSALGIHARQAMRRAQYEPEAAKALNAIEANAWEREDLELLAAINNLDREWPAARGKQAPFVAFALTFLQNTAGDLPLRKADREEMVLELIGEMFSGGMACDVLADIEAEYGCTVEG